MEILGDHTTTCSRTNTQGTTIAFIEADEMVWYNPIIYNPEVVAYFKGLQVSSLKVVLKTPHKTTTPHPNQEKVDKNGGSLGGRGVNNNSYTSKNVYGYSNTPEMIVNL